jgi:hypothetical protein
MSTMSTMCTPPVVTFWRSLLDTAGRTVTTRSWAPILHRLECPSPYLGDDRHPGWSPGRFAPTTRCAASVREMYAIVLDYDGTSRFDQACECWSDCFGIVHTTRNHTSTCHRFRVVLPLSRPVSAFEYRYLWMSASARADNLVDPPPKDPSRFWFLPGVRSGGTFVAQHLDGKPIDVDRWLADGPIDRRPQSTRPQDIARAIAYVVAMPAAISGQGGHDATWRVARKLAQDFCLDEAAVFAILCDHYNPRCEPVWSEAELRHKAHEATRRARVTNPVSPSLIGRRSTPA